MKLIATKNPIINIPIVISSILSGNPKSLEVPIND